MANLSSLYSTHGIACSRSLLCECIFFIQNKYMYISMGESNTDVSANTTYMHLQQYCSYPSICKFIPSDVTSSRSLLCDGVFFMQNKYMYISMGENNTDLSAYTTYNSIALNRRYVNSFLTTLRGFNPLPDDKIFGCIQIESINCRRQI